MVICGHVCCSISSCWASSHLCWSLVSHSCCVLALAVNAVQSLIAYPVNSTCVILTWTLSPQIYVITSLIIEWRNLNKEEEMKWVRVPPNTSKYYIYGECVLESVMHYVHWYGIEEHSIPELTFLSSHLSISILMVRNNKAVLIIIRGLTVAFLTEIDEEWSWDVCSFFGNTIKLALEYWPYQLVS